MKQRKTEESLIQTKVSGRASWKRILVEIKLIMPLPTFNPSAASHCCQDRLKCLLCPQVLLACHMAHLMFLLPNPINVQVPVQSQGLRMSCPLCGMCAAPLPGPRCYLTVLLTILVADLFSCMSIWCLVPPVLLPLLAGIWSC